MYTCEVPCRRVPSDSLQTSAPLSDFAVRSKKEIYQDDIWDHIYLRGMLWLEWRTGYQLAHLSSCPCLFCQLPRAVLSPSTSPLAATDVKYTCLRQLGTWSQKLLLANQLKVSCWSSSLPYSLSRFLSSLTPISALVIFRHSDEASIQNRKSTTSSNN